MFPSTTLGRGNSSYGSKPGAGGMVSRATTGTAVPTMTREMALQILLKEKATKSAEAQKQAREREQAEAATAASRAVATKEAQLKDSYLASLGTFTGGTTLPTSALSPTAPSGIGNSGVVGGTSNGLTSSLAGSLTGGLSDSALSNTLRSLPTSVLAEYLAASQRTQANTRLRGISGPSVAPTAPLLGPTRLGNLSSMSDNQIRDLLHTLQRAAPPPSAGLDPVALASAASAADPYEMMGLMRNQSRSGVGLSDPYATSTLGRLSDHDRFGATVGALPPSLGPQRQTTQSDIDKYASEYANKYGVLTNQESIGAVPPPTTADRNESLGFQQAIQEAMRFLNPTLDTAESLDPTPLRPGVSAALAQMKRSGMTYGANAASRTGSGGSAGAHAMGNVGGGDRRVFWVPPNNIGGRAPSISAMQGTSQRFETGVALSNQFQMTEPVQRGQTGGSLDDLCRAAGMYMGETRGGGVPASGADGGGLKPGKTDSDLLDNSDHGNTNTVPTEIPKRMRSGGLSRKMKMFQGVVDAKQSNPLDIGRTVAAAAAATTTRGPEQGSFATSDKAAANQWALEQEWKNVKTARNAMALKLGKNDNSLMDDSDDEDDDKPIASMSTKRKRAASAGRQQRSAKRQQSVSNKKGSKKKSNTSGAAPSATDLNAGVSFSQIRSLPMTETPLDRGHSLAMSEVSFERGQSLLGASGAGDEGQFDDASEGDADELQGGDKTNMMRGITFGTVHTFSDLMSKSGRR